jgi:hypothetical protein
MIIRLLAVLLVLVSASANAADIQDGMCMSNMLIIPPSFTTGQSDSEKFKTCVKYILTRSKSPSNGGWVSNTTTDDTKVWWKFIAGDLKGSFITAQCHVLGTMAIIVIATHHDDWRKSCKARDLLWNMLVPGGAGT